MTQTIAIASIQRDRNPYILEWIAFHLMVGFNQIIIYSHKNQDGMNATIRQIAAHYPVILYEIDTEDKPQAVAYQHAIEHHLAHVDWMAFIDGDEFLFPTQHKSIQDALAHFEQTPISAIGVYWKCYGSSGHLEDPSGLIMEQFTRHSAHDFHPNTFIKSIVRGRDTSKIHGVTAHFFPSEHGTVDEKLRPISWHEGHEPSYEFFRINHYLTQSYDFYRHKKSTYTPPDGNLNSVRTIEFFDALDTNECDDGVRYKFLTKLKLKI